MSYSLDFSAVIDRLPELLVACLATIGLAIAGMSLATIIGSWALWRVGRV